MKVVLRLNEAVVLDSARALLVLDLLAEAETFQTNWKSSSEGGSTYHVYPLDISNVTLTGLSNPTYQMYKLAGKPTP